MLKRHAKRKTHLLYNAMEEYIYLYIYYRYVVVGI